MSVYPDASILVALFTQDAFTQRATAFLSAQLPALIVSDFASVEFASAVARLVRTREITQDEARVTLVNFDSWRAQGTDMPNVMASDIATATQFIRRLDLTLRTADAINIAIAQRLDSTLATFDGKMAASTCALDVHIADL